MPNETLIVEKIRRVIGNPRGKCYVASEAAYHLLGGKKTGYTPMVAHYEDYDHHTGKLFDTTHWWLRRKDGTILDITYRQFAYRFPYEKGKGCGFMTKNPSKRAQEIIDAVANG